MTPCTGENCTATNGIDHSYECFKEHNRAYSQTSDPLDTPGNRHTQVRYAGYTGEIMGRSLTDDEKAAYQEGVNARERI